MSDAWSPPAELIEMAKKYGSDGVALWVSGLDYGTVDPGFGGYTDFYCRESKVGIFHVDLWVAMKRKGDI